MNTILIATDFTSSARNATKYGFELARHMQAKVILFTAYKTQPSPQNSVCEMTVTEMEKSEYKRLLNEAETVDPQRTVSLETECESGPVSSSVYAAALLNKASYIVLGMKERGKEMRKYFGSTVTDLCKISSVPQRIIPADAVFVPLNTIALANDISDETDVKFLKLLEKILEYLTSKLFVVRIIKRSMDKLAEKMETPGISIWLLTAMHPSFGFLKADSAVKGMNTFVKEHAVNMLVAMPHEHTLLKRLFTKSVKKRLVFNVHVPLLVLPSKRNGKGEFYENKQRVKVNSSTY